MSSIIFEDNTQKNNYPQRVIITEEVVEVIDDNIKDENPKRELRKDMSEIEQEAPSKATRCILSKNTVYKNIRLRFGEKIRTS